uniref:Uncharacterized protein n=1 Tax=Arundo donax TaxID=35708 RepID=A0A0A9HIQ7_ARUDO
MQMENNWGGNSRECKNLRRCRLANVRVRFTDKKK